MSDGSLTSQGFDSAQVVHSNGHEIQSNGMALVVTNTCGRTACDESLELPDASLLDFVEVSAGMDPLVPYELTQAFCLQPQNYHREPWGHWLDWI